MRKAGKQEAEALRSCFPDFLIQQISRETGRARAGRHRSRKRLRSRSSRPERRGCPRRRDTGGKPDDRKIVDRKIGPSPRRRIPRPFFCPPFFCLHSATPWRLPRSRACHDGITLQEKITQRGGTRSVASAPVGALPYILHPLPTVVSVRQDDNSCRATHAWCKMQSLERGSPPRHQDTKLAAGCLCALVVKIIPAHTCARFHWKPADSRGYTAAEGIGFMDSIWVSGFAGHCSKAL